MLAHLSKYALFASAALLSTAPAWSQAFHFSTGSPDGLIGTASRPATAGQIEIETADDFVLDGETAINGGTFTGLLPSGTDATNIGNVIVEIYRVFPLDSADPPSGHVPTRANSPSDVAFTSRDASAGEVLFFTSTLNPNFTVGNSVINGINPLPNVFTGGEGPVLGQEVRFDFSFLNALDLVAGHYFFVPQVQLLSGNFLWLSAPKPIVSPGTPFLPDLQSWIRNENLAPDWLRIGTDITHQGPFNAAFSLDGFAVPEPSSWLSILLGFAALGLAFRRGRTLKRPPEPEMSWSPSVSSA